MDKVTDSKMLEALVSIVRDAGKEVMSIYKTNFTVDAKDDSSPVTVADRRTESLILNALADLAPDIPAVSEEAATCGAVYDLRSRFWLVDPLDGTKEFINRNGEFTVNIALIEHSLPTLGVVFAPAIDRLFAGSSNGAFCEAAHARAAARCRVAPSTGVTVVTSRSHTNERALSQFLAKRHVAKVLNAGSSLKLCLVANGEADLYPRLGTTMEWDTAAGHAVLRAAGGEVRDLSSRPLIYGKPAFVNPHFVAHGESA